MRARRIDFFPPCMAFLTQRMAGLAHPPPSLSILRHFFGLREASRRLSPTTTRDGRYAERGKGEPSGENGTARARPPQGMVVGGAAAISPKAREVSNDCMIVHGMVEIAIFFSFSSSVH